MKIIYLLIIIFLSCNTAINKPNNSTDVECVSNFMQNMYMGNFAVAKTLILNNEANNDCLQKRKFAYNQTLSKVEKETYKTAGIIFLNTTRDGENISFFEIKDPVSNKKLPTIRVVQQNKEWLIDLAYSCSGNL